MHSAKSLFEQNIVSARDCLDLFDGVAKLKTALNVDWVLRASIVFVVSAIDTYFHDKIRYRVGRYSLENLPPAMAGFQVPIAKLINWDKAKRKGNVLRNWVTEHYSVRPLQSQQAITEALKLADIHSLWDTIEPDKTAKKELLATFNQLIKRRNEIAHEGDRQQSRRSGKKLRPIDRDQAADAIEFAEDLVNRIETAFPK